MTAQIIILPVAPLGIERAQAVSVPSRAPIRALTPRHRHRMKALAAEWGVSLETAVVIMVTAYIDAEQDK